MGLVTTDEIDANFMDVPCFKPIENVNFGQDEPSCSKDGTLDIDNSLSVTKCHILNEGLYLNENKIDDTDENANYYPDEESTDSADETATNTFQRKVLNKSTIVKEENDFKEVALKRKTRKALEFPPTLKVNAKESRLIFSEIYNDILSLPKFLPTECHPFYKSLRHTKSAADYPGDEED
ncbi:hypothetical protein AVEN_115138-1 [Araneus ventricosus]|uniref:Uncharacterized protein n=1 Tax=Araneus ventricosus TaxID=182803 RepID=A0A4Y1ZXY2_ARAVE|nr:hypothetical protein AVEN_115138-1 [Araneus ventricosus]